MAGIQTAIELQDNFSSVMYGIINSVNLSVAAMYDMQQSLSADLDTSSLEGAREEIAQATAALYEMNEALQNQPALNVPQTRPEPATQPTSTPAGASFAWTSDNLEVFNTAGLERWEQEVQSANQMLATLNQTQQQIVQTASGIDILPFSAMQDIDAMEMRLQGLQQRIQQMEADPISFGTEAANAQLEQLRTKLSQAVQEQGELNAALQRMDVSAANAAYLRLSRTVSATEGYIRDNVDQQARFNQEIRAGTAESNNLMNSIGRMVAAYVSIQSVGKVIDLSDSLTQTTARLDLMNDGLQSTEELVNMVYESAKNTHAPFLETAETIARLGNNAGNAFDSTQEIIAFTEQLNKQFAIGGATATEQSNALIQLSQAMAAGALRGDELNSILDAAPGIARTIEQSMGWAEGSIKSYAEQGLVTADVVKYSLLDMADVTNEAFDSMPITFSQAMTDIATDAVKAFQPVLDYLNDMVNSQQFQVIADNAYGAFSALANIVLDVFDLMGTAGAFVADNWSIIGPIVYGIVAAFTLYNGVLFVYNMYQTISNTLAAISTARSAIKAGATLAEAAATQTATGAQVGLNAALLACPITWIVIALVALVVILAIVCSKLAETSDIAQSGFGVFCGAVNVAIQFVKNLLLTVVNSAFGMGFAIGALGDNIQTAFHNAIANVTSGWYGMLSTVLFVIDSICAKLNELPFIEFDYSGVTSAAEDYAAKASKIAADRQEYVDIGEAFRTGNSTFDTFQDGWVQDAFDAGANFGDGISDSVSSFFDFDTGGDEREEREYDLLGGLEGISDGLGGIADDTGAIKDSIDVSEEDLKYLRDLAEQEAVNRFTTAEIKLDMTTNNNVSSSTDLDGIIDGMTTKVLEAMEMVKEGV